MAGIGYGTRLLRGATPIGEVTAITPHSASRDTVETTHFDSPDGYREFIGGLKDAGEFQVTIQNGLDDLAVQALYADMDNDAPETYIMEFPGGASFTYQALVTSIGVGTPIDDRVTTDCTFKVSGKPVYAAA